MPLKAIDGLPVINAKHAVKIHITPGDISRSDRKEPDTCAAARACRRELHCADVRIHLGRVYIRQNKNNYQRYMTPRSLRTEIIAFDRGGKFMPGEYLLSAPQPSKRASGKSQSSHKRQLTVAKKKVVKRRPPTLVRDVRHGPA